MTEMHQPVTYGTYFVAFIDVLGQQGELRKQTGFSDAFVIGIPLFHDDKFELARSALAVLAALHSVAIVVLRAMGDWGIPVRGGIDVGVGVDLYPNEVYGPVTVSAYSLESTVADYPRVVIGSGLLDYLALLENAKGDDLNTELTRRLARSCREIVCEAPDQRSMMLHLLAGSVLAMNAENANLVPKLLHWVRVELERYRGAGTHIWKGSTVDYSSISNVESVQRSADGDQ